MKTSLAFIPLLFIGCIPNRLVPYDFTIEKNNIEAFVDFDSVTVAMVNLEIKNDHYVFGMEIVNRHTRPIFIDVAKIRKYAHHYSYHEEKDKDLQEVVSAMSPKQVNQFFENKKKGASTAAAFLFLIGAAITIYDAVEDEKDSSKEYWTERDEKKSLTRDIVTSATLITTDVLAETAFASEEQAEVELNYLPEELFDRKIIYPGESYNGKVLFRRIGEVRKYHRIVLPLKKNDFLFDFRKATPKEKRFLYERGLML